MCTCSRSRSAKGRADQHAARTAAALIERGPGRRPSTGSSRQSVLSCVCGCTCRLTAQDAAVDSPAVVSAGDLTVLHLALYTDVL